MAQIFLNNCYATLAQAVSASDTTLELSGMNGFPGSLGSSDFFLLTLFADTTRYGENIEVVKVTGLSGSTATVERGFEGEALAHAANERAEARLTAETMRNLTPTWEQVSEKPSTATRWPNASEVDGLGNAATAGTVGSGKVLREGSAKKDALSNTPDYLSNSGSETIDLDTVSWGDVVLASSSKILSTVPLPFSAGFYYIETHRQYSESAVIQKVWEYQGNKFCWRSLRADNAPPEWSMEATQSDLGNKADKNHNHSASDITSGTFSENRLPGASRSTRGAVRVYRNGSTGRIYTSK